jgi:O-antigen ligase
MTSYPGRRNIAYLAEKIQLFTTCLFAFGINMPDFLLAKFAFLWIISLFFYSVVNYGESRIGLVKNLPHVILVVFYLWSVFTCIYSENLNLAYRLLETRLLFILVPLSLIIANKRQTQQKLVLWSFVIGNLFAVYFSLTTFLFEGLWGSMDIRLLNFKSIVNAYKHYNYFGLNLCFSLFSLGYLLKTKKHLIQFISLGLFSLVGLIFILLVQSRISLFCFSISVLVLLIQKIIEFKYIRFGLPISFVIMIILLFVVYKSPAFQMSNIDNGLSINMIDVERSHIWKTAFELFRESPIFGYGIGDVKIYIQSTDNLILNAHNQFVEFLLEGGIVSLFLFIYFWIVLIFYSRQGEFKFFSIVLSLVFLSILLVESIFNRISGVSLFILFYYLLMASPVDRDKEQKDFNKLAFNIVLLLLLLLFLFIVILAFHTLRNTKHDPLNPFSYANDPTSFISYDCLPPGLPKNLPVGVGGIKLTNSTKVSTWNNNSYQYVTIRHDGNMDVDSLFASVFCYVSKDFDGSWAGIRGACGKSIVSSQFYNLAEKGQWQKLSIPITCASDVIYVYLSLAKSGTTTMNDLNGFVIFVYPKYW